MRQVVILRVAFIALLTSGPVAAAPTALDYAGSQGAFIPTNGNLTVESAAYGVLCMDFTNSKMWYWNARTQLWNNAAIGSQDPAGNVGGYSISALNAGPYFPAYSANVSGQKNTANFGAFPVHSLPSGFSSWNSIAGTTTWNPSDKSVNITLSNGDLTATEGAAFASVRGTTSIAAGGGAKVCYGNYHQTEDEHMLGMGNSTFSLSNYAGVDNDGVSAYQRNSFPNFFRNGNTGTVATTGMVEYDRAIRSTNPIPSGSKKCAEVTLDVIYTGSALPSGSLGIVDSTFDTNSKYVGETASSAGLAVADTGRIYINDVPQFTAETYIQGHTVMIAVDRANAKMWVYNPNTSKWNSEAIGTQNPETNTGGLDISGLGATIYFATSFADVKGLFRYTWNFGATAFSNICPPGFNAQDAGGGARFRSQIIQ